MNLTFLDTETFLLESSEGENGFKNKKKLDGEFLEREELEAQSSFRHNFPVSSLFSLFTPLASHTLILFSISLQQAVIGTRHRQ